MHTSDEPAAATNPKPFVASVTRIDGEIDPRATAAVQRHVDKLPPEAVDWHKAYRDRPLGELSSGDARKWEDVMQAAWLLATQLFDGPSGGDYEPRIRITRRTGRPRIEVTPEVEEQRRQDAVERAKKFVARRRASGMVERRTFLPGDVSEWVDGEVKRRGLAGFSELALELLLGIGAPSPGSSRPAKDRDGSPRRKKKAVE